jgi:importin subunit alpha-6/7
MNRDKPFHLKRFDAEKSIRKNERRRELCKRPFQATEVQSIESDRTVMSVNELPVLVTVIRNTTGPAEKSVEATRHIRRMISASVNPPVKEVIESRALPYLVQLLMRTDDFSLQFEALWVLTNVTSTTNYSCYVADQPNAIHYMICLLKSPCALVREQSAWCLANIAADGPEYRDNLLKSGCMEPL